MLIDRLPKTALLISHGVVMVVVLSGAMITSSSAATDDAPVFADDFLDPPSAVVARADTPITHSTHLEWTATPDAYAMGYNIYRMTVTGAGYTLIGTVTPGTATGYVDTAPHDINYYVVTAFYRDIESEPSAEAVAVR